MSQTALINSSSCDVFKISFYQFAQMKKFCLADIDKIKSSYKQEWEKWKYTILQISNALGTPFAKPHIESWTNGWQVRAHFFAYFKYEYQQHSATILSVILNRRRFSISLDWHCYRADRSQIKIEQYNQWLEAIDLEKYSNFELWRGDESEYADFKKATEFQVQELILRHDDDFWCIGKNIEQQQLDYIDIVQFSTETIKELLPLYDRCHQ
ncbi:HI_0552 family protein [Pasteurella multocida]